MFTVTRENQIEQKIERWMDTEIIFTGFTDVWLAGNEGMDNTGTWETSTFLVVI